MRKRSLGKKAASYRNLVSTRLDACRRHARWHERVRGFASYAHTREFVDWKVVAGSGWKPLGTAVEASCQAGNSLLADPGSLHQAGKQRLVANGELPFVDRFRNQFPI
jgi:hypothetical protein